MRQISFLATVAVILAAAFLATVAAPTPALAGLFDDIKKRGQVTVATEAAYYPFEFVEEGKSIRFMTPRAVECYIEAHGLYRAES